MDVMLLLDCGTGHKQKSEKFVRILVMIAMTHEVSYYNSPNLCIEGTYSCNKYCHFDFFVECNIDADCPAERPNCNHGKCSDGKT